MLLKATSKVTYATQPVHDLRPLSLNQCPKYYRAAWRTLGSALHAEQARKAIHRKKTDSKYHDQSHILHTVNPD